MKRKTKIFAFLLTLVMLVGMIPTAVFAAAPAETEIAALDALAEEATGNFYQMPGSDAITFDQIITDGVHTASGFVTANGAAGTSTGPNVDGAATFKWNAEAGEKQWATTQTYRTWQTNTFEYSTEASATISVLGKKLVYSMDVKRGEALEPGINLVSIKFNGGAGTSGWCHFLQYRADGKLALTADSDGVAFSTAEFTNVSLVFDFTNVKSADKATHTIGISFYANGALIETSPITLVDFQYTSARIIGLDYNTPSYTLMQSNQGHFFSLGAVRAYTASNDTAIAANIASTAGELANGVFKKGDSYYLYENGNPVIGTKTEVGEYTITTAADTGVIESCRLTSEDNTGAVLDTFASQSTGSKYSMISSSTLVANIGSNGSIVMDGEHTSKTFTKLVNTEANFQGPNNNMGLVWDGGEAKFSTSQTYATWATNCFMYANCSNVNTVFAGQKFVYSMNIKRGAALPTGVNLVSIKHSDGASHGAFDDFLMYRADGKLALSNESKGVAFSTSEFTNVTLVFDYAKATESQVNVTFYANGAFVESKAFAFDSKYDRIRFIAMDYGQDPGVYPLLNTHQGHFFSIDEVRAFMTSDDTVIESSINSANGTLINGIIKSGDDYYLYENGNPVIGDSVIMGDYMITTDKFTGAVSSCAVASEEDKAINNAVNSGKVYLKGYSITLEDNIGMNFYAAVPNNVKWATLYVGGIKAAEYNVRTTAAGTDGFHKLTAPVSSHMLGEEIALSFDSGSGNEDSAIQIVSASVSAEDNCYRYTASVESYLNTIIADDTQTEQTKGVAEALLIYGEASKTYFVGGENSEKVLTATAAIDTAASWGACRVESGESYVLGMIQLVLGHTTAIRINLTEPMAELDYDFHSNPNITYNAEEGYIQINNIKAHQLNTTIDLTIDGAALKMSVTGVAQLVVTDQDGWYTDNFNVLARALKLYSDAANAYKASLA